MRAELVLLLSLAACGPPDAPAELNGLTHFLYREWAYPQATVMEDGVLQLDRQLNMLNLGGDLDDRSFQVTPLDREDVVGVSYPMDRDPHNAIGSCVARRSKWPIDDQVKLIQSPEQLDAEPSAKAYERRFIDPMDPACFTAQGCPVLATENHITRENSALSLFFVLYKNLRWVRLGPDRWAVAARSYSDRSWPGTKDGTAMHQSYSIDVFLGQADGSSVRYQCSWSETKLEIDIDDGIELAVLVDAVDRALAAADDAIGKRFHGE